MAFSVYYVSTISHIVVYRQNSLIILHNYEYFRFLLHYASSKLHVHAFCRLINICMYIVHVRIHVCDHVVITNVCVISVH